MGNDDEQVIETNKRLLHELIRDVTEHSLEHGIRMADIGYEEGADWGFFTALTGIGVAVAVSVGLALLGAPNLLSSLVAMFLSAFITFTMIQTGRRRHKKLMKRIEIKLKVCTKEQMEETKKMEEEE